MHNEIKCRTDRIFAYKKQRGRQDFFNKKRRCRQNLKEMCRQNGDMRVTKEVVRQKIIAARDLIKYHPLTPELATELFTNTFVMVFRWMKSKKRSTSAG